MNINGMNVIVNAALDVFPRMQVSPRFADLMPADFVADLNAWMREFFGTHAIAVTLDRNTVAVGPKTLQAMREASR
jgi:hypothetical protein